jgi:hypothetical protein
MNEVVIPLKITGIAALKAELKDLKNALASATDPAQMSALAQRAGEVADQLKDVNEQIKTFATGSKFEQVSNSFGAIQGDLMAMDFEGAAEKSKTFATALGSINPKDISKGFKDFTGMLGTLGKAFLKLGMTILMNPIFLIVAAVVAIIAVVALVLKSFGVLDDVIKALMAPINALIAGFKAMTDWLGLTAFAAEENAEKTLAANEKVTASSNQRTAILTADLGREIAEAKAAGKDTTKLEQEKSNVQIKEANNRKKTAKEALDGQKALGDKADQKKIEDLKKQIIAENEIIKQGYSDKKVAKLTNIANDAKENEAANKEAAAKQKAANDKYAAADKASMEQIAAAKKIVTDSAKTAQQIELDDLKAAYVIKIAEAVKYKNDTTALLNAQKIQEAAINNKYEDEAKAKTAANMASSHAANIAKIDAYNAELAALTDTEEQKLYDKYAADLITFEGNELALFNIKKKYEEDTTALKKTETDKQKAITDKARADEMAAIKGGLDTATDALNGINSLTNIGMEAKLKNVKKGSKEEEKILRAQFKQNKIFQLAMAAINGAQSILAITATAVDPTGISTAIRIGATVAATAASIATIAGTQFGGGASAPTAPDVSGGGAATTAVAPAAGPNLFGQANTGSQVNAGGGTGNNITVTAIVSETEITASQNNISNIQQNSVL